MNARIDTPIICHRPASDLYLALRHGWAGFVYRWNRQRHRRRLLAMDDRLLEDIGLTRTQAQAEGMKPFWKD
ncbi:MAG: DUF1127 domain-containing protein [Gammaproteobacteria bacterium]